MEFLAFVIAAAVAGIAVCLTGPALLGGAAGVASAQRQANAARKQRELAVKRAQKPD